MWAAHTTAEKRRGQLKERSNQSPGMEAAPFHWWLRPPPSGWERLSLGWCLSLDWRLLQPELCLLHPTVGSCVQDCVSYLGLRFVRATTSTSDWGHLKVLSVLPSDSKGGTSRTRQKQIILKGAKGDVETC